MNEIAKGGAKETITQSIIDKAAEFLGKIVNPPFEELGLLAKDTVKYWRFKNQVNIILKAKKFLEDKGISPQKISLKILVPLLENGSLEEDEFMKTKWASLLANSLDPNYKYQNQSRYVEILNQISPKEASFLDKLYATYEQADKKEGFQVSKKDVLEVEGMNSKEFDILVENLFRLNLIKPPASQLGFVLGGFAVIPRTSDSIQLTALGIDFINACSRK